jgi:hypothetical protein
MTLVVILSLGACINAAQAQTATVYGSLGNFDVINNTGHEAHGFEIQLEGLHPEDVYGTFSVQRYGNAIIVPYATGVYVRWTSSTDPITQQFIQTTAAHAPNTPFAGSCYQWGPNYNASGCEHFGAALRANPTKTTYRWLIADAQTPGALTAVDPPVAIPGPTYLIQPPVQAGNPPVLVAEVEAPEPPEAPELYGNAQWMRVFKTELPREVALEELLGDNPIVPQDAAHVEVSWDLVQASPPSNGNQRRHRNQGGLNLNTRSVIRRYEMYQYTGAYDPITHKVVCGGDGTCNAPVDGEVGDYIGAQMAAANVVVPSVTVSKVGNGSVSSADRLIICGSKCAAAYEQGAAVTLTASPSANNFFTGWSGASNSTQPTCTVTVDQQTNVAATFAPAVTLSVKTSGGKGKITSAPASIDCGKTCSARVAQGTVFTLSATPEAGFRFVNWTGACSGTAPTCNVTVNNNASVQANFTK